MESATPTTTKSGIVSFSNLERIMFMRLSWEAEQSNKFNTLLRVYRKCKVWKSTLILLLRLLLQNTMPMLHLIITNMKIKLNMLKLSLKISDRFISAVNLLKLERYWIGSLWLSVIQCQSHTSYSHYQIYLCLLLINLLMLMLQKVNLQQLLTYIALKIDANNQHLTDRNLNQQP